MSTPTGWRQLQQPRKASGAGFVTSPFTRLARVHALSAAGDAMVAIGLAGSLFFSIDPAAARPKVALYLLLTFAPFAVVAPLIGPAIDRMKGGRKLMVLAAATVRCVVCALMVGHIDSLLLFPLAFLTMVAAKGYSVAKSALVPSIVVDERELVEANSKLQLISGVMAFVAGGPALLLALIGSHVVMAGASVVFACAAVAAIALPSTQVAAEPAGAAEVAELRTTGIILAASAMALLRAMVGFLTFHVAFFFRSDGASTWWFAIPVTLSGIGGVLGAALAPIVRRHWREELMIIQVLTFTCVVAVAATWGGGRWAASFLAGAIALSAAFAKLAFDSIVQRDAPDANQGRTFARFETRFQLAWVTAAFVPVIVTVPGWVGFLVIAAVTGFAAGTYLYGQRYVRTTGQMPPTIREVMAARGLLPRRNVPGDSMPPWARLRARLRRSGVDGAAADAGATTVRPTMTVDSTSGWGVVAPGPGAMPSSSAMDDSGPVSVARSPLRLRGRWGSGASNVPGGPATPAPVPGGRGDPLLGARPPRHLPAPPAAPASRRAAPVLPDPLPDPLPPPPPVLDPTPPPPPPVLDPTPPPPPPAVDPTQVTPRPDATVADEALPLDRPER